MQSRPGTNRWITPPVRSGFPFELRIKGLHRNPDRRNVSRAMPVSPEDLFGIVALERELPR